jgi:hypothetical protein
MLPAIKLNGKFCLVAIKVYDKSANWVLTAEFVASQSTIAQQHPQKTFDVRLSLAKGSSIF